MASKRKKGDRWEFTVKRAGILEKPLYFTFASETEPSIQDSIEATTILTQGGVTSSNPWAG